jgi:hypothetical protein
MNLPKCPHLFAVFALCAACEVPSQPQVTVETTEPPPPPKPLLLKLERNAASISIKGRGPAGTVDAFESAFSQRETSCNVIQFTVGLVEAEEALPPLSELFVARMLELVCIA